MFVWNFFVLLLVFLCASPWAAPLWEPWLHSGNIWSEEFHFLLLQAARKLDGKKCQLNWTFSGFCTKLVKKKKKTMKAGTENVSVLGWEQKNMQLFPFSLIITECTKPNKISHFTNETKNKKKKLAMITTRLSAFSLTSKKATRMDPTMTKEKFRTAQRMREMDSPPTSVNLSISGTF